MSNAIVVRGRLVRRTVGRRPPKPPAAEVAAPPLPPKPSGPSRLARQLALAHFIENQIEAGAIKDYAHAARLFGVTRARVTQVMNLLFLPVAEQEDVLLGRTNATERSVRRRALRPSSDTASN